MWLFPVYTLSCEGLSQEVHLHKQMKSAMLGVDAPLKRSYSRDEILWLRPYMGSPTPQSLPSDGTTGWGTLWQILKHEQGDMGGNILTIVLESAFSLLEKQNTTPTF